jgi:hypothetical protein
MSIETGSVVRVMTRNGAVGYIGEIVEPLRDARYGVRTPDDGEIHRVHVAFVKPATETESDDYIERWIG